MAEEDQLKMGGDGEKKLKCGCPKALTRVTSLIQRTKFETSHLAS